MSKEITPKPCTSYKDRADMLDLMINMLMHVKRSRTKEFNLGAWGQEPEDNSCGTSCCIMGYASLEPVFRNRGLHMTYDSNYVSNIEISSVRNFNKLIKAKEPMFNITVSFDGMFSFEAVEAFFAFPDSVEGKGIINWMFDPDLYEDNTNIDQAIKRLGIVRKACLNSKAKNALNKIDLFNEA